MLALEQSVESNLLAPGGGASDRSDPPPLATGLDMVQLGLHIKRNYDDDDSIVIAI